MSERIETVGLLGTGIMGAAIGRNLAGAGLGVRAWNRTRTKAEALRDAGAEVADSPAAAVAEADVVITMLADGEAVGAAAEGEDGALAAIAPGAVWLQMSTIGIAATERMAALASEAGVAFVDAPVLGTRQPAEQGKLTVLASGTDDALDRCEPIFAAIAASTLRLGDAGAGNRMKLVVNTWILALTAGVAEAISLAEGLSLDPRSFLGIIEGQAIDSGYAQLKGKTMIDRSFPAAFPLDLAAKDARLAREAAERHGLELALIPAIERRFAAAAERGHGREDMAAIYTAYGSDE